MTFAHSGRRLFAATVLAGTLTGCQGSDLNTRQMAPATETLRGNYQAIADCAFNRLEQARPGRVRKAALNTQRTSRISIHLPDSQVDAETITLRGIGPNQTSASFTEHINIWAAAGLPTGISRSVLLACQS